MRLSEKLASLRKEKGLTQLDLAERLSVSRQAISRWEVGTAVPSTDNLKVLSDLYGVSVDYLLNDDAELPPDPVESRTQQTESQSTSRENKYRKIIFILVLILVMIITAAISAVAGIMAIQRKNQKEFIPIEELTCETNSHSDRTFTFG